MGKKSTHNICEAARIQKKKKKKEKGAHRKTNQRTLQLQLQSIPRQSALTAFLDCLLGLVFSHTN